MEGSERIQKAPEGSGRVQWGQVGSGRVSEGPGGFRRVRYYLGGSKRVQESTSLGWSRKPWEAPEESGRVQEGLESYKSGRVQDSLGGSWQA